jgi:HSP20 family protein
METQSGNGSRRAEGSPSAEAKAQASGSSPESARSQSAARASEGSVSSTQSSGRSMTSPRRGGDLARAGAGHPFSTMLQLSREMDRLMDSFFGGRSGFPSSFASAWPFEGAGTRGRESGIPELWSPRVDVRERGDSILVSADLPGVRKEDVRIEATDDGIAISGERSEEREEGDERKGYRLAERSYGSFYRQIPLPEGANVEQAKASMREGVLEITIPVQESQRRRRIQIE